MTHQGEGSAVGEFERIDRMDRARVLAACDTKPAAAFNVDVIDFLVALAYADAAEFQDMLSELKARKVSMTDLRKAISKRQKATTIVASGTAGKHWLASLDTNVSGQPLSTVRNVSIGFENDPEWRGIVAFDALAHRPVLLRSAPYEADKARTTPRDWENHDTLEATAWFQSNGLQVSDEIVEKAMLLAAGRNKFDPLHDYMNGLVWDGVPRLNTFPEKFLGCDASKYAQTVFPAFMISAVARGLCSDEHGVKVDTILVLEGTQQGEGKSSLVKALFAVKRRWFTENLPDMHRGDDAMLALVGRWGVEIGEGEFLDSARSAEAVKNFLSRQVDSFRIRWDRFESDHPRRCVMISTTNLTDWNKDPTGARRYWPFRVGAFDVSAIEEIRDQLWAEAVVRFREGEKWWFSPLESADMVALIREETDKRRSGRGFDLEIAQWLQDREKEGRDYVRIDDVLGDCLHFERNRITDRDRRSVGATLRSLGWISATKRVSSGLPPVSVYIRSQCPSPSVAAAA